MDLMLRQIGRALLAGPAVGRKSWEQPPFWELDRARYSWLSNSTPDRERIENDYDGYAEGGYKRSGVVFTCTMIRQLVLSEARFQWQRMVKGRPGDLWGNTELALLEEPWPNGDTGELLAAMDLDLTLAGNFYATTCDDRGRVGKAATGDGRRIAVLRPDWVTIIVMSRSGDPRAIDAKPVGYLYEPPTSGRGVKSEAVLLDPAEVCHYRPLRDPAARFRGMSWLTPVLGEVTADKAATTHKRKFFENGATLGPIISFKESVGVDAFDEWVERIKAQHEGVDNAYKMLALGGGADVSLSGATLQQLDFKATQGAGETRIAAASGVGAIIAQFSEGMQGSSLNAGNYGAARRRVADALFRPLWRSSATSLRRLVNTPPGSRLWFDDRDIPFLREDAADIADIHQKDAITLRQLSDAGCDWDAAVAYIQTGDLSRLVGAHSGLFSVQLQPPGTQEPSTNGDLERVGQ